MTLSASDVAAPDVDTTTSGEIARISVQVDLTKCVGFAQCCFASPETFWMTGQESLEYRSSVEGTRLSEIRAAAAACPVQAISFKEQRASAGTATTALRDADLVIVGASLAGLEAAGAARAANPGSVIALVDPEQSTPYDRPPLSKAFLADRLDAHQVRLLQSDLADDIQRLNKAAVGLDRPGKQVILSDGERIGYGKLVIATGANARAWPDAQAAGLDGVISLRTLADARALKEKLHAKPNRVCVIGAGFIGTEIASTCRPLGIAVTVLERGPLPLVRALGAPVGEVFARMLREHDVDLRLGAEVKAIRSAADGHRLAGVELGDGELIDCEVVVVALGAARNTGWLKDAGLLIDERGIATDRFCRVLESGGQPAADIFAAGDVTTWPSDLVDGEQVAVEHWSNAIEQGRRAGRNAMSGTDLASHDYLPTFWSSQFGVNIKSAGLPGMADGFQLVQGSLESGRFAGLYGRKGRVIAAVTVEHGRHMPFLQELVRNRAEFPQDLAPAAGPLNLNRPE